MKKIKVIVPYLILTLIITTVFIFTIQIRKPWFGQLINGDQHYLTGSSLKFARNWYQDKPWNIAFGMIEQPRSIEYEILKKREPYVSYPPGSVLPNYLVSQIFQKEPTVSMVMGFNLFSHITTALLLTFIAFFLLDKELKSKLASYSLSWIPGIMFLLLPGVMFWQQNVYFADQAIILPFVLTMFIEIIRDYSNNRRVTSILNVLQTIVIIYGLMTDYLFFFLLCILFIKRLTHDNRIKSIKSFLTISIKFWWPTFIVYSLFLIQVWHLGALINLKGKFFQRTGFELVEKKIGLKFFEMFWLQHIFNAYGKQAFWIIWISLFNSVAWIITFGIYIRKKVGQIEQKNILRIIIYSFALTLPHFIQIYLLPEHSYMHDFSALKFSLIIALVPFIIIPVQIVQISKLKTLQNSLISILQIYFTCLIIIIIFFIKYLSLHTNQEDFTLLLNSFLLSFPIFILVFLLSSMFRINKKIIVLTIIIFAILLLYKAFPQYKNFFGKSDSNYEKIGNEIRKCVKYNDVLISPVYNAPSNPPQMITFTMKPIHKITSFKQIKKIVSNIDKPYNLIAIFPERPKNKQKDWLKYKVSERICERNYYVLLDKRIIQ